MEIPTLKAGVAAIASYVMPTHLIKSELDSRGLSHDPEVVAAYDRDPMVFKTVSPRWFFEIQRGQQEVLERAGTIRLPTLFLLGDADPIANPKRSYEVFERLGSPDKRLEVYPGFFHEVFNELERGRVVHDLLYWLDERAPLAAAGPSVIPEGSGGPLPAR
jgi:alpha-beta hydrolase superfamily lysophospholipase